MTSEEIVNEWLEQRAEQLREEWTKGTWPKWIIPGPLIVKVPADPDLQAFIELIDATLPE